MDIEEIYGPISQGIVELQDKLGWYNIDDSENVLSKWEKIKTVLSEAPSSDRFKTMLKKVGLDFAEFGNLYSDEKINKGVLYGKDLKDRYTVLWLYYNYFRS